MSVVTDTRRLYRRVQSTDLCSIQHAFRHMLFLYRHLNDDREIGADQLLAPLDALLIVPAASAKSSTWSLHVLRLLIWGKLPHKHERHPSLCSGHALTHHDPRCRGVAAQLCDVVCIAPLDAVLVL